MCGICYNEHCNTKRTNVQEKNVKNYKLDEATLKSLANKIAYYASQKVKAMFVAFILTIVNAIFTILGTTFGGAVAKIIDRHDKKRNNGYCFGF